MPDPKIPAGVAHSQYFVRERKDWAVQNERFRHDQALLMMGEPAMFVLMWKVEDWKFGYVRRCPRCYKDGTGADVYDQPTINKCPMCFGTTFEGGVRAKIIRPTLFGDVDDQEQLSERGTTYPQHVSVESTSDFRFRAGDFIFRADGSRWQLGNPTRITLRTGYGHPSQGRDSFAYIQAQASLQDKTNVAWIIPPSQDDLMQMLTPSERWPISQQDLINGPLIPEGWTD